MTKQIPLTQGKFAIVDDMDYDWLAQWKWFYSGHYAARSERFPRRRLIFMQNQTIPAPKGCIIDHADLNKLNNTRANLRIATYAQNNHHRPTANATGYRGVTQRRSKWLAQITVNHKVLRLGWFKSPEDAARAYNEAAIKYFGEFATLNEIPS